MTSVYESALGDDFEKLHPRLRERYGFDSGDGVAHVGRGRMERVESNPIARPILALLARRDLPFPETGRDVPFSTRTDTFEDADGNETLVLLRGFEVGRDRRFDARMTYDPERGCVVDALGRAGRLVTELHPSVGEDGALLIRAGRQWLRAGGRSWPVPRLLRASVDVEEGYDDAADRYLIDVTVTSPLIGFVFGYSGTFTAERVSCDAVPAATRQVGGGAAP